MDKAYIGLIGGMLGAIIALSGTWFRERQAKIERAHYLAARIVIILDDLIWKLARIAKDDGYLDEPREYADARTAVPDSPRFPDDVDWKSIPTKLAYRILMIPIRFEQAKESVGDAAEHASPPDYEELFDARREQYALLGLEMHAVTQLLRRDYKVAPREKGYLDPIATFKDACAEIKKKHAEYRAENARVLDEWKAAREQ